MENYTALIRLQVNTTTTTTTKVAVKAMNSYTAKLQLEALYGKGNVMSAVTLER